ncbi:hypothetical protein [Rubritalea tangerina]|uniref:hypothetical protein n=1 Tax=Rubritalea tangerina TaxID=430798 RepID=UPI003613E35C
MTQINTLVSIYSPTIIPLIQHPTSQSPHASAHQQISTLDSPHPSITMAATSPKNTNTSSIVDHTEINSVICSNVQPGTFTHGKPKIQHPT